MHKDEIRLLDYIALAKGINKITRPLTFNLRIANSSSENLVTSVDMAEENELVGRGVFSIILEISAKSQKFTNLSKSS